MAIKIGDNFLYRGKKPLDERDSFNNIADMKAYDETSLDEGHISYCKSTDKYYKFNSSNSEDTNLGKWREYTVTPSANAEVAFDDYDVNTPYKTGKYVVYNNIIYKVLKDYTSKDISTDIADGNIEKYIGDTYNDTNIKKNIASINKAIGDMSQLSVVGVTDIVSALNKIDLSFMQSIVFNTKVDQQSGKPIKVLTITYKNNNSIDVDISGIITSTNIGELKNVDDTGITDKQVLSYDIASNKYIPTTIDTSTVLTSAKNYTDSKFNTLNKQTGIVVDSKPSIVDNGDTTYTITYVKDEETKTTNDTNIWFYYPTGTGDYSQTIFISGTEVTLSVTGGIDLTDYVNKNKDLANGFTGTEVDTAKITTIKELQDLLNIVNTALGKKIGTTDVIDDLYHQDSDKPLSAKQGNEIKKLIDNSIGTISGNTMLRKVFENVKANEEYTLDSAFSLKGAYISGVYKIQDGTLNQSAELKKLSSNTKQDFIKNANEIIIDDGGVKIKDGYDYKLNVNTAGFFETNIITKNDFIDIIGIEVI